MAPTSLEGRRRMEQEVMLAYLLQLNRYALENELITKEIYKKMEIEYENNVIISNLAGWCQPDCFCAV